MAKFMRGVIILGQVGCGRGYPNMISPMHVKYLPRITFIHSKFNRSLAVSRDGFVFSWGWNSFNQLGHDDLATVAIQYRPQKIANLFNIDLVCSSMHFCYFYSYNMGLSFCGGNRTNILEIDPKFYEHEVIVEFKSTPFNSFLVTEKSEFELEKLGKIVSSECGFNFVPILKKPKMQEPNDLQQEIKNLKWKELKGVGKISQVNSLATRDGKVLAVKTIRHSDVYDHLDDELKKVCDEQIRKERKYKIMENIGNGSSGSVDKAIVDNVVCALKKQFVMTNVYDKKGPLNLTDLGKKRREIEIMQKFVKSKHVIEIYDYWCDADSLYIAMELCNTDLGKIIESKRILFKTTPWLDFLFCCALFEEITESVAEIHRHDLIHRDLTCGNILINYVDSGDRFSKICDFGLSIIHNIEESMSHTCGVGTPNYMAPEVANGHRYSRNSDIHSLGWCMHILFP